MSKAKEKKKEKKAEGRQDKIEIPNFSIDHRQMFPHEIDFPCLSIES